MFFPHAKIRKACSGDLDDPKHFDHAARLLLGDMAEHGDQETLLRGFLKSLPSVKNQVKIVRRFRAIAKAYGASIRDFRWWDIMRNQRILFATVNRNGRYILVAFHWKKTDKGIKGQPYYFNRSAWGRDFSAPGGWRYEFEATTYQDVKAQFERWLANTVSSRPPPAP